jgi:uncharacterized protein (TIGR02757 family)
VRNRIALNAAKNNAEVPALRTESRDGATELRELLEPLYARYHDARFLASDPLEFPHRFEDPWDQEAVAILSAVLAYGNVRQIRRSVEDLLERIESLGLSPAALLRGLAGPGRDETTRKRWREASASFVHRFNVGSDLFALTVLVARSWAEHGSVGAHLASHLAPADRDFGEALSRLFDDWAAWMRSEKLRTGKGFGYLFTPPRSGSACKRWCMLARWMGRKDRLDLGLWMSGSPLLRPGQSGLRPDQLVMPLDTHVGRISQYIDLTERKVLGWKAATEITDRLRECDPRDPVRYDFALARLGILDLCQRRFRVEICAQCDLLRVCRFARKKLSSSGSRSTRS